MPTHDLTVNNFSHTLARQPLVLVDFWKESCLPCRAFSRVFQQAAAQHPDVFFGQVNVEQEPEIATVFHITSAPSLAIIRDGIVVFAKSGMADLSELHSLIAEARGLDMGQVSRRIQELKTAQ